MLRHKFSIEQTYGFHVFYGRDGDQFLPKMAHDEWLFGVTDEQWSKIDEKVTINKPAGEGFVAGFIYRRLIPVGAGFELVRLDDQFDTKNCEHTYDGTTWYNTGKLNDSTPRANFNTFKSSSIIAFRRKVKVASTPAPVAPTAPVGGWNDAETTKPKIYKTVLVSDKLESIETCQRSVWTAFWDGKRWDMLDGDRSKTPKFWHDLPPLQKAKPVKRGIEVGDSVYTTGNSVWGLVPMTVTEVTSNYVTCNHPQYKSGAFPKSQIVPATPEREAQVKKYVAAEKAKDQAEKDARDAKNRATEAFKKAASEVFGE